MSRLLILCEFPTLSGGERSMLSTLDGVARAGFDARIMAPDKGPLAEACRARRIPLIALPWSGCHGHLARAGSDATRPRRTGETPVAPEGLSLDRRREQLAEQLARLRPDVLHANSLAMGRLAGPVAAELDIASVAHLRDIIKLSAQAIRDLNRNTRLLAVSKATRSFHVGAGLNHEKTFVLYNGVNLAQFHPRPPRSYLHRELGIPTAAPLIGCIGQICLRKAQDVLLDAALNLDASGGRKLELAKTEPRPSGSGQARTEPRPLGSGQTRTEPRPLGSGVAGKVEEPLPDGRGSVWNCVDSPPHWLVIGERFSDKPESRQFEQQLHVAAEGLAGRVHFLGARDDVPRLLNELTLLVHTARQEPLGRVLLEAAASGVPVVATGTGGTPEIFPPGSDSARLVEPDNTATLAAAIAELLARPERRDSMAAAARRRAEEQFDAARATVGLVAHYRTLTE